MSSRYGEGSTLNSNRTNNTPKFNGTGSVINYTSNRNTQPRIEATPEQLDELHFGPIMKPTYVLSSSARPTIQQLLDSNPLPIPIRILTYDGLSQQCDGLSQQYDGLSQEYNGHSKTTYDCSVCYECRVSYDKVLSCGHPICMNCLLLQSGGICPHCNKSISSPMLTSKMYEYLSTV